MNWSAKQYVAFEDERTRPVRDLLSALLAIEARSIVDLGCGPGNSTEVLAALFPDAAVRGLDSSPDMISAARRRLPRAQFSIGGIETWSDAGPYDVILANAVLQWIPDHAAVLPALLAKLSPGGALAVQMPDNLDVPAHRLLREPAGDGP
jgi:trans-aconitate 2-methyltransferase